MKTFFAFSTFGKFYCLPCGLALPKDDNRGPVRLRELREEERPYFVGKCMCAHCGTSLYEVPVTTEQIYEHECGPLEARPLELWRHEQLLRYASTVPTNRKKEPG